MPPRHVASALALVLALGLLPGFVIAGTTLDRVVAVVNRDVILASELSRRASGPATTEVDERVVLQIMIDELLLVQAARDSYLTVSSDDVDRAIDEIKSANQLSDADLDKQLQIMGTNLDEYRVDIERQILALRVINLQVRTEVVVTDAEIKTLYAERVSASKAETTPRLEDLRDELTNEIFERKLELGRIEIVSDLRRAAHIDIRLGATK